MVWGEELRHRKALEGHRTPQAARTTTLRGLPAPKGACSACKALMVLLVLGTGLATLHLS